MMRQLKLALYGAVLLTAVPVLAHVTPNVQLVKRGEFVKQTLPGAVRFLEKQLTLGQSDLADIRRRTHWTPSEEDVKIYVGRDGLGQLAGSVIFIWVPSEHGPVGLGVAYDGGGKILRAEVTDVGSEPLAWVRPLLQAAGLAALRGLPLTSPPDARRIAPAVTGRMSRYYAEVIAGGVARTQALEPIVLATGN
jgi:hypothetical protein